VDRHFIRSSGCSSSVTEKQSGLRPGAFALACLMLPLVEHDRTDGGLASCRNHLAEASLALGVRRPLEHDAQPSLLPQTIGANRHRKTDARDRPGPGGDGTRLLFTSVGSWGHAGSTRDVHHALQTIQSDLRASGPIPIPQETPRAVGRRPSCCSSFSVRKPGARWLPPAEEAAGASAPRDDGGGRRHM